MAYSFEPPKEIPQERQKVKLFAGLRRNKGYAVKVSILILIFWALQFFYQYYTFSAGDIRMSLVRSFSFSGATLISLAVACGPVARLTKYNYIFHRRTVGVWGFTFIIMHVFSVLYFVFNFNTALIFWSFDPFVNAVLFGLLAFSLYWPLYLTSTDWAAQRLGYKRWKKVHSLIYLAYIFSVLHYLRVNPLVLYSIPGYLLLAVTALAIVLQMAGFVKTIRKTKSRKALITGILIILFGAVFFYAAFF